MFKWLFTSRTCGRLLFVSYLILFSYFFAKVYKEKNPLTTYGYLAVEKTTMTESAKETIAKKTIAKKNTVKENADCYFDIGLTNDTKKKFEKVSFTCQSSYIVCEEGKERKIKAGKKINYEVRDRNIGSKILIYPNLNSSKIQFLSLKYTYGHPSYPGIIALFFEKEGITVVNRTDMESYLALVIPSEISSNAPIEALKTQAVCARSYAASALDSSSLKRIHQRKAVKKDCILWDNTDSQVYNKQPTNKNVYTALEATKGEVLKDIDTKEIIRAWYYSTSWGFTADASVWASKDQTCLAHLDGEASKKTSKALELNSESGFKEFYDNWEKLDFKLYDKDSPWFRWKITASKKEILKVMQENSLDVKNKELKELTITSRSEGGGAETLVCSFTDGSSLTIKGMSNIRSALGSKSWKIEKNDGSIREGLSVFPSAFFYLKETKAGYKIYGGGFGHGVGMSQWAVKAMANEGKNYAEILHFFYNNVEITDGNE